MTSLPLSGAQGSYNRELKINHHSVAYQTLADACIMRIEKLAGRKEKKENSETAHLDQTLSLRQRQASHDFSIMRFELQIMQTA